MTKKTELDVEKNKKKRGVTLNTALTPTRRQKPTHKGKALKEAFRSLNRFLNGEGLIGKETAATDGTKMRTQNAKKKNYTEEKLDKKIAYSDANIAQYLDDLDQLDKTETYGNSTHESPFFPDCFGIFNMGFQFFNSVLTKYPMLFWFFVFIFEMNTIISFKGGSFTHYSRKFCKVVIN